MTTDINERGLERLICAALTGAPANKARMRPATCAAHWNCDAPEDAEA